jgi:hypothetical protein
MIHKYQQSLKNAQNENPRYLTRKLAPITDDIFSQVPIQDTSYQYDSFVVKDDEEEMVYESKI